MTHPLRSLTRAALVAVAVAGLLAPTGAARAAEREPTTAQVQAEQSSVAALEAQAREAADAQDDAEAELEAAALVAADRLEAYSLAVKAQQQATQAADDAQDQLTAAHNVVTQQRARLGAWVRVTYQQGLGISGDPTVTAILTSRYADAGATVGVLRYLGNERSAALRAVEVAEAHQERLTEQAADLAQAASETAIKAGRAKDEADAAMDRQRSLLAAADSASTKSAQRLLSARQSDALSGGVGTSVGGKPVTGKTGSCKGGQMELYANGKIPLSALCPLWANGNHYLRADAAYGFNRLSKAYLQAFGAAPCITDSYRSYASQVRLAKTKPTLAAKPGTSNHGWGTALDLCGGINSYGTKQYRWMLVNAPLYGWFHPSWARQGGGREEPWHWEFGG
ncbi:D-alanyl-D-alanine carboxypeptidase family protein [Spongisporangium articulatum]|uniref:D-alanyl-D-alanine carboxypeptidase family protein n=1 Tax=Spongisporangium articulatum TaxID=3362603 RepID=A0ABW8ARS0_9ACTN